ncbi:MAG: PKD domain-containing protein [Saprospiraceae bacterium]|nr:PKD domain-containing protein [Saprospiraceae bacterium]
MKISGIKISLVVVILFVLKTQLFAQVQCPCIENECGVVVSSFKLVSDSTIVCDGTPFEVQNNSTVSNVSYFIWDWGDGTRDSVTTMANQMHTYNISDQIVCNRKKTVFEICLLVVKNCGSTYSCHSNSSPVTVIHRPKARFNFVNTVCKNTNVNFTNNSCNLESNDPDAYLWTFHDGTTSTEVNPPPKPYTAPGIFPVRLRVENNCGNHDTLQFIQVVDFTDAKVNISGSARDSVVCVGDVITLIDTSNIWSKGNVWTFPLNNNQNVLRDTSNWIMAQHIRNKEKVLPIDTINRLDTLIFTVKTPGTYNFRLTSTNACGTSMWIFPLRVVVAPTINLPTPPSLCESGNYTPGPNIITGDIISVRWDFPGGNPSSSTMRNPGNIFYAAPGTYPVTLTVIAACDTIIRMTNVFVAERTSVNILDNNPRVFCQSSSPYTFLADTPGGIWSGQGIVNATTGVFNPAALAPGNYTITYNYGPSGCSSQDTFGIRVVASGMVVAQNAILCENSPLTQLIAMPSTGTWSGDTAVTPSGIFDPAISGIGTFSVNYQYTDVNGCFVERMVEVVVEAFPVIAALDTALLCSATGTLLLTEVLQLTSNPSGGMFFFEINQVIAGQNIDLSAFSNELVTVAIRYQRNDCEVFDTAFIRFVDKPVLLVPNDTVLCIDAGSYTLQANLNGGTWSGPGINPFSGSIDLNAAGQGTFQYFYSFQPNTSCFQEKTVEVEIKDPGSNLTAGIDQYVCEGENSFQFTGFSPTGGTWSGTGVTPAGLVDISMLVIDQQYTYTYCLTENTTELCQACRTKNFIVHSLPIPSFVIDGNTCINEDITFMDQTQGNNTIRFDFGDGTFSTNNPAIKVYYTQGNYLVILTATNTFGCQASTSQNIYVTTRPLASFVTVDDEGCAPFDLEIQNTSSGDGLSFEWLIDGMIYNTQNLPDIFLDGITKDSIFVVQLAVSNLCGTVFAYDSVLVYPYPIVDFGINELNGCSPLPIHFSNPSLGNPDTYFWDYGNGNTSLDSIPEDQIYVAINDSITLYTVTLSGSNACGSDSISKVITVFPPDVTAFIEFQGLTYCQYDTAVFRAFSTPGAINTWQVFRPDGTVFGASGNSLTTEVDLPGTYTVILFASRCGSDTDTVTFQVFPAPDVSLDIPEFACQNDQVIFGIEGTNYAGAIWDYGDGNTDNIGIHVYNTPGIYEVSVTVFSLLNNCPITLRDSIRIVGLPTASFIPSVMNGCLPLEVDFSNQGTGGTLFDWSFGDMTSNSNEQNPSHTYRTDGTFTVTLTVFDQYGCFTDTSVVNIIVFPKPESDFSFENKTYCLGYDTVFLTNNSLDITGQEWRVNGLAINTFDYEWFPQESGNYEISLIVFNQFGCRDSSSKFLMIELSPLSFFISDISEGCQPLEVSFTNQSENAGFFIWNVSNGTSTIENNFDYTFKVDGDFLVQLITISSNGCPNDTSEQRITVYPKPTAAFGFTKDTDCGVPVNVTFNSASTSGAGHNWVLHNNQTSNDPDFIFTYTEAGTFEVFLDVTTVFGCRDTTSETIPVYRQPVARFEAGTVACERQPFPIINFSENATSYEWMIDGQPPLFSPEIPSVQFEESGNYFIQLIASYNEFCKDTFRTVFPVIVYDSPTAEFTYTTDYDDNVLGEVTFENASIDYDRSFWDFGDRQTSVEDNPVHEYDINRDVLVVLVVYNDNNGAYTCTDTFSVPVEPEWITTFFAPNAFAPEYGPGDVSFFKPVGIGLAEYKIIVYSPWGEAVWSSDKIENESPAEFWDGFYKGAIVPQGAYSWIANITFVDGVKKVFKGSVSVLR